jgi:DNA polymerase V
MMQNLFVLVDCNNFYVSCERVFEPRLQTRPVVVVSGVGGCALARSNEAKKLGIMMSQPYFEWEQVAVKNNIKVLTPNFSLYADMSNRVMRSLTEFSEKRQVYSIDECFLDITYSYTEGNLFDFGSKIKQKIQKEVGIPVSVGISITKTLAKATNEYAKVHIDCDDVAVAIHKDEIDDLLHKTTIEDVWGIGRQTATKLHISGIHTAHDFANQNGETIQKTYGGGFYDTWLELRGTQSTRDISELRSPKRSIMHTRTYGEALYLFDDLLSCVASHASECGRRLRARKLIASFVTVFIKTNRFVDRDRRYTGEITVGMQEPSSDTKEISKTAIRALRMIFKKGYIYKKVGLILSGLIPESEQQLSVIGHQSDKRGENIRLMKAVDMLNDTYGHGTIRLALEGMNSKRDHYQPSHLRSLRFTTRWDEIKQVK